MPIDPTGALAPSTSPSGLNIHVNAGVVQSRNSTLTTVPQQIVALTASSTNFVYFDCNSKTIAVSLSSFGVPSIPIAIVVTNIGSVTSLVDSRPDFVNVEAGF